MERTDINNIDISGLANAVESQRKMQYAESKLHREIKVTNTKDNVKTVSTINASFNQEMNEETRNLVDSIMNKYGIDDGPDIIRGNVEDIKNELERDYSRTRIFEEDAEQDMSIPPVHEDEYIDDDVLTMLANNIGRTVETNKIDLKTDMEEVKSESSSFGENTTVFDEIIYHNSSLDRKEEIKMKVDERLKDDGVSEDKSFNIPEYLDSKEDIDSNPFKSMANDRDIDMIMKKMDMSVEEEKTVEVKDNSNYDKLSAMLGTARPFRQNEDLVIEKSKPNTISANVEEASVETIKNLINLAEEIDKESTIDDNEIRSGDTQIFGKDSYEDITENVNEEKEDIEVIEPEIIDSSSLFNSAKKFKDNGITEEKLPENKLNAMYKESSKKLNDKSINETISGNERLSEAYKDIMNNKDILSNPFRDSQQRCIEDGLNFTLDNLRHLYLQEQNNQKKMEDQITSDNSKLFEEIENLKSQLEHKDNIISELKLRNEEEKREVSNIDNLREKELEDQQKVASELTSKLMENNKIQEELEKQEKLIQEKLELEEKILAMEKELEDLKSSKINEENEDDEMVLQRQISLEEANISMDRQEKKSKIVASREISIEEAFGIGNTIEETTRRIGEEKRKEDLLLEQIFAEELSNKKDRKKDNLKITESNIDMVEADIKYDEPEIIENKIKEKVIDINTLTNENREQKEKVQESKSEIDITGIVDVEDINTPLEDLLTPQSEDITSAIN